MAKISARGAREIARWTKTKTIPDLVTGAEESCYTVTLVLCSDGRLLQKLYSTGNYSIVRKFSGDRGTWVATVDKHYESRGYVRA